MTRVAAARWWLVAGAWCVATGAGAPPAIHQATIAPWPATFVVARAYLDQLERSKGLAADRITAVRAALGTAESAPVPKRRTTLNALATQLDRDAATAADGGGAKVRLLAGVVRGLAK